MANLKINDGVTIDYSSDGWDEFKKWLDGTYAYLAYTWVDEGLAYALVAIDGKVYRTFSINKTDATDFETNYKVNVPTVLRNMDGSPIVAERLLVLGQAAFQRVDNGSELMNIDGSSGGTPSIIWNGTGASDTGGDWSVGGSGSEQSAADAGSGTNGWDTGVLAVNNATTFDNGSMVDIDGTYDSLEFMLNPQAFPVTSRYRVGFLDASNVLVGNWVRVEDYTVNMDIGVWKSVQIPVSDFALTGNAQKIRFQARVAANQRHYLDDIQLVPAGGAGPYRFQVAPNDASRIFHVSMIVLIISGASSGWNATTFGNISALTNGLLLRQRRISDSEILWRFNSKDNVDLFGRYHPQDDIEFADGTLLVGFMVKPGKASIKVTDDDVLEFVVRDDLSGLGSARAYVHYGLEEVV